jgi:hypothetical protein
VQPTDPQYNFATRDFYKDLGYRSRWWLPFYQEKHDRNSNGRADKTDARSEILESEQSTASGRSSTLARRAQLAHAEFASSAELARLCFAVASESGKILLGRHDEMPRNASPVL